MIKYWHHIKTATPKGSLVYKVINYTEKSKTQEHCRWLSTVKFILKVCNLSYVREDSTNIKHGTLNDVSCCPSKKQTQVGNKLRTYKLIKYDYKMETYLYHIMIVKSGET